MYENPCVDFFYYASNILNIKQIANKTNKLSIPNKIIIRKTYLIRDK
jgi:hypothetical protein